jgi:hypothetical protein
MGSMCVSVMAKRDSMNPRLSSKALLHWHTQAYEFMLIRRTIQLRQPATSVLGLLATIGWQMGILMRFAATR